MLFDYPRTDFFYSKKFQKPEGKNVDDSFIMTIWKYTSADEFGTLSIYIKTCKNLGNHSRETKIIYKGSFIIHFFFFYKIQRLLFCMNTSYMKKIMFLPNLI